MGGYWRRYGRAVALAVLLASFVFLVVGDYWSFIALFVVAYGVMYDTYPLYPWPPRQRD